MQVPRFKKILKHKNLSIVQMKYINAGVFQLNQHIVKLSTSSRVKVKLILNFPFKELPLTAHTSSTVLVIPQWHLLGAYTHN